MLNEMTWLSAIPLTTFLCTTIERPMIKLKILQSQSKSLGPPLPTTKNSLEEREVLSKANIKLT
jgi:hypothetical protein